MDSSSDLKSSFRLAEWLVEPGRNRISGPGRDVHVSPKSMDVLVCLAEHAGEVVNRDDFSTAVWGESVVTEDSLTGCISQLRRAFGDSAASPEYIETISKRGYRLRVAASPACTHEESRDPDHQVQPPGTPLAERRRAGNGERRGAQMRRGERRGGASYRLALLGALLALAVGLALWYLPQSTTPASSAPQLAVLPFENLSPDPANAFFAGGLHDELITQLSKIKDLSLRGRTSMLNYAGTTKSVREIAEELNADTLLEGSVQAVDGRLRVNVQLIDAVTDEHLWAESYDHTLDDVFAIQSHIVERVVQAVGARLDSEDARQLEQAPTNNPAAYRFYLQGQGYFRRPGRTQGNLEVAQQLYEQALELDPKFALAHAALAEVHASMRWRQYDSSVERVEQLRVAAETAVRLAPDLPEAHQAMGQWHYHGQLDWQAALEQFEIAQRGQPADPRLTQLIAYTHRRMGNWNEALAGFRKVAELDPRNPNVIADLGGNTYNNIGRFKEAIDAYDDALALAPDFHAAALDRAWAHVYWRGNLTTVRQAIEALPDNADLASRGSVAAERARLLHWERDAEGLLELMERTRPEILESQIGFHPKSLYAGWAHRLRSDPPSALAAFETALSQIDTALERRPDDWRVHSVRGLTLAGLGRHEDAVAEADWLAQSPTYRNDAYGGQTIGRLRARILAQAREAGQALDEIDQLLATPSGLSIHYFQLDPLWDPIREHPRFLALVAETD